MGVVLKTLDRYLLKELGPPFVLGAGVLTFFLVIDRVYDLTDLVITKNVPFHLVMGLLAFMLPAFLGLTLPMALLVAVLIVSGRMAADMEVAAFKASGVSPLRLFRPFVLAACVVSAAVAFITLIAAPAASGAFQNQLFQILQTKATTGSRSAPSPRRSTRWSCTWRTSAPRRWPFGVSSSPTSAIPSSRASSWPGKDGSSRIPRSGA